MSWLPKLALFFLSSYTSLYAQSVDTVKNESLQVALQHYQSSVADQSDVYNGSLYLRIPRATNNDHAYFRTDSLLNGDVMYSYILYKNIPLLFDEVNNDLVSTDISGLNLVKLVKSKISAFNLANQQFIKLNDGFFQLLYNGRWQVLLQELKFVRQRIIRENESAIFIDVKSHYYLRRNDKLTRITKLKVLLDQFGSGRKRVQDHLRSTGIRFREMPDKAIIEAVKYYEKIISE